MTAPNKFNWPIDDPVVNEVLTVDTFAATLGDLKWEPATWGNITGQAISLDLYLSHQVYANRTDHTKKLKEGEKGKTRKLDVFVFEHNGHVFFVSMIKQGYGPNTIDSEKDKAFVKNIKQNIKSI